MPDMLAHWQVAEEARTRLEPGPLARVLDERLDVYKVGAQGPDFLFYSRVWSADPRRRDLALHVHQHRMRDVFHALFEHAAGLPAEEHAVALAFACGYAAHLCLDAARKKRPAPADPNDLPPTSPEGAERLALGDRAAAVRHALATLPANQRAAVILRYYENLGYREIAESLGCSEKAVERLLARARAALAALLEGMLEN